MKRTILVSLILLLSAVFVVAGPSPDTTIVDGKQLGVDAEKVSDQTTLGGGNGSGYPESLESYFKHGAMNGFFMGTRDPGPLIKIRTEFGLIQTVYSGVSYETLSVWEKEAEAGRPRRVLISYSKAGGVVAREVVSGVTIKLLGAVNPHPIEWATRMCNENPNGSYGIKMCAGLEQQAWKDEVGRIYQQLGGDGMAPLKRMHSSWLQSQAETQSFVNEYYYSKQGTVWPIYAINTVIRLWKERYLFLGSLFENYDPEHKMNAE